MKRKIISPAKRLRLQPAPGLLMRMLTKVKVNEITGCWEWTAHCDTDGYPQINVGGRTQWAHRVFYAVFVRTIPDGREVDHRCLCPKCVNPSHLRTKTKSWNSADANRRRSKPAIAEADYIPF